MVAARRRVLARLARPQPSALGRLAPAPRALGLETNPRFSPDGRWIAAAEGRLFYLESVPNQPGFLLHRFDLKERKADDFLAGVTGYSLSRDGKKLLYAAPGNAYGIVATDGKAAVGDGKLDLAGLQTYVDPRVEWTQMFDEFWRIERDFLYDPGMHGVDWKAVKARYRPFLAHVGHRSDLTYLIQQMMSEIVLGHLFAGGGDEGKVDTVKVGLLGVDYSVDNGFYRFARICGRPSPRRG